MINNIKILFMKDIEDARFMGIDDLFIRKDKIRRSFAMFDMPTKEIYKWYFFYQLCLIKDPLKSEIWEYVCGKDNKQFVEYEYEAFCERRDRLGNLTKEQKM